MSAYKAEISPDQQVNRYKLKQAYRRDGPPMILISTHTLARSQASFERGWLKRLHLFFSRNLQ